MMFRPEWDDSPACACRVCPGCSIVDGPTPHSLCAAVACRETNRFHECACPSDHPKRATR